MRQLIINADGYGFTEGCTRAIEECIAFGTVRSISVNVNLPWAERLPQLVKRYPYLSVGCHLNPVVGRPVLPPDRVRSLLGGDGEFLYRGFTARALKGGIDREELRAELLAQIDLTARLAGPAFSHVDFHMGLHRLPNVYPVYLDAARASGVGRIRTHRYLAGLEGPAPRLRHAAHLAKSPARMLKYAWNLVLRQRALRRGLAMPDWWVCITGMSARLPRQSHEANLQDYLALLGNLPRGFSEFVAHPGYVDDDLQRYSTYLGQREQERLLLMDERFRSALAGGDVRLAGHRDIALRG